MESQNQVKDLVEIGANGHLKLNFHPGQWRAWESKKRFIGVLAGTQSGKGAIVTTMIPTPEGFIQLGDLKVGDQVFGVDGYTYPVIYVSPVHHLPCYEFNFSDRTSGIFDNEHLWCVQSRKQRKNMVRRIHSPNLRWSTRKQCRPTDDYSILTTEEISRTWHLADNINNYSIDLPKAVQYPNRILPLPPYTFGAWLGDGSSDSATITCGQDESIIERIRTEWPVVVKHEHKNRTPSYSFGTYTQANGIFKGKLSNLGVLGNKHIPEIYLTADINQRLELLRGLLDTDGYCDKLGYIEFYSVNKCLAEGVFELVRSLGILARLHKGVATLNSRVIGPKYRVYFKTVLPVFTIPRKLERLKAAKTLESTRLFITNVKPVDSVPTRCIMVDSPSSLYLFGRSYIPTHNTSFYPHWLYREIQNKGPGDYIVATPTYPLLGIKALPEFRRVFEDYLFLGRYIGSPTHHFTFSQFGEKKTFGNYGRDYRTNVFFGHASDPESLEAATAKAACLDEAGQKNFKLGSWEAIQRRLSIHQGRALITTTIYNLGWLKSQIWDRWRAGDEDIDVINFSSIANPRFPREEFERARRKLPRWKFDMFYKAIFTRPAGLIYDCFDDKLHTVPRFPIPDHWPCFLGLDFGGVHTAGLFYAQEPGTNKFYLYREYMAGGRTVVEHAAKLLENEPGIPFAAGGSKSESQWRQEFAMAGLPVREPVIDSVEVGIDRIYGAHKAGQIIVFDDLAGYLDEKLTYSRELDDKGEPTEKIEDKESFHFMDAERYLAPWFSGEGELQVASMADIYRR